MTLSAPRSKLMAGMVDANAQSTVNLESPVQEAVPSIMHS